MTRATWFGVLLAVVGCDAGPPGVRVTGRITFKGQPVPAGRVSFDPDAATPGGQQGFALIKDGRYDTAAGGKPPSPGKVLVRVDGFGPPAADGAPGPALFATFEARADLPASGGTHDVDVPATAGKPAPAAGPQP